MIRGVSHAKGVMFIGPSWISHTWKHKGVQHHIQVQKNFGTILLNTLRILILLPMWCWIFVAGALIFISVSNLSAGVPAIPWAAFILMLFSFHFWFPGEMRKYHAAEHQVFSSYRNRDQNNWEKVIQAPVVNRNCSTNIILMYFIIVLLLFTLSVNVLSFRGSISFAAFAAVPMSFIFTAVAAKYRKKWLIQYFYQSSFWLQRFVTTSPPDKEHVVLAISAFQQLMEAEKRNKKKFQ